MSCAQSLTFEISFSIFLNSLADQLFVRMEALNKRCSVKQARVDIQLSARSGDMQSDGNFERSSRFRQMCSSSVHKFETSSDF
mmetsp:Transcript_36055/g.75413  ORF Transcript_36055/g.75413 Transcript_36055/m.75413 type:complete len:83 (+) Transcript_36055:85-333(+)